MNRKKCSFEISNSLLANCAKEASAFAKNLYYRELEFEANAEGSMEELIEVYMKLGQPENAYGLFKIASKMKMNCKIEWY